MPKNRKLQNIIGTEHITDAAEAAIAAQASGGATVAFKNVAVAGQDNVVADAATDTLNIAAGANVTITTNAGTDTLTVASADTQLSTEAVQDIVGAMFTSNTETNITATYEDSDGTIDLVASAGGGGAIASIQDLKPQLDSSMLEVGDYQKTLGGAPFFLNLASWSVIQWSDTYDYPNTNVVFFPYMGSGETMVKARVYRVSGSGQNNDTRIMFAFYASDSDGLPTGAPVNSGNVSITNPQSSGAAVLEGTWTNGPTLTAGELYWLGLTRDTVGAVTPNSGNELNMGNIRSTPSFEQEALGFTSSALALNNSNFGRITGLKSSTGTGTTNGSRAFPTIGAGTISLATGAGYNIPRVSFEVTYS